MALIDQFAPEDAPRRAASVHVPTPPGPVFAALREVTPAEIENVRGLLKAATSAGGVVGLKPPLSLDRPLYAQMMDIGFVMLGVTPMREIVVGRVARPLKVLKPDQPRPKDKKEYLAFDRPKHVKLVTGFLLKAEDGGTTVTAELRATATDPATARWIARAWPIVGPPSEAFARGWLQAIAKRVATTSTPPATL